MIHYSRRPTAADRHEVAETRSGEPLSVEQFRRDFAAGLAELLRSRPRGATPTRRVRGQSALGAEWGPEFDEDGRMLWRCAFCGELGTAREGEPIALRSGATLVRILLPPNWRQQKGKPVCPACRKASGPKRSWKRPSVAARTFASSSCRSHSAPALERPMDRRPGVAWR